MKNLLTRCLISCLAWCLLFSFAGIAQTRRRLPARSASTPVARTSQTAAPSTVPARASTTAAEPDGNLDELVARGTYALLSETRSIVESFDSPLVTESLAPLRAAGIVPPETIVWMDFVKTHRALLAQSRAVAFVVPLKPSLPQFLFALETPGADDARTLEPQVRRLLKKLAPSIAAATGQTKPRATNARRGSRSNNRSNARNNETDSSSALRLMRVGRTLIVSDAPVKLDALRPTNAPSFIADAQMRDMRSRFMPSTAFIYFDANGFRTFMAEQSKASQSTAVLTGNSGVIVGGTVVPLNQNSAAGVVSSNMSGGDPITPEPQAAVVTPAPPPVSNQTGQITATVINPTPIIAEPEAAPDEPSAPEAPPAPSAIDRLSSSVFPALFGGFTRGYESVEAVGAAFNLDSEAASIRVLIANKQGIPVGPIPLLPFIVSGKPLATQAANLMPVETGIFASVSLDMPRIYDEIIGSAKAAHTSEVQAAKKANAANPASSSSAATLTTDAALSPLEASIFAIETQHNFKFRDELLAAFGSEIAFGVSEKWITKEMSPAAPVEEEDDDDATTKATATLTVSTANATASPTSANDASKQDAAVAASPSSMGMYFLIAVQDKARLQRLLPVALELAGIKVPKDINLIERRDGVESVMFTNNMVSFVGDYLLLTPDAEAARAVIKAFREGGGLAADNRFTAARSWQKTEKLGEFYVANTLVKALINMSQKSVLAAIGNVPNPYAGIDIDPRAVTYTITADPLGAQHELRIPIDAVRLFSQTSSLAAAHQEVITNDAMAQSALRSLYYAQLQRRYKITDKMDGNGGDTINMEVKTQDAPFVSLEELSGKSEDGEDDNAERFTAKGYRIEMSANGSTFEATATPEVYGKSGRRSFFINEKGNLRGGDLAGRNATASDKRIN
ncbi:MAG: hypothetical protein MSG64_02200 [Pyrinomonadaceae bacterium MAG19_C2-C3]|nr:hypothetical protein [Pyrinomonadaceae bacterium MAG19_C2-C3]